ncbi:MAG: adenylate/guanylate cyclase domain-containing protein [Flavobacteriales bacterium]
MPRSVGPLVLASLLWPGLSGAQQYDLRTFSLEQGLPSAAVNALCEDHDGFLWVATDQGAARSEGLHFETVGRAQGLPSDEVTALFCDNGGRVWIGCRNGAVSNWQDGTLELGGVPARAAVRAFAQDRRNTIWVATLGAGIARIAMDGSATDASQGLPSHRVNALVCDGKGRMIAATDSGLCVFEGDRWRPMAATRALPSPLALSLYADTTGLLVGTDLGYAELDVDLRPLAPRERFTGAFPILLPDPRVLAVLRARNGDLWFGTPEGMVHMDKYGGQPHITVIGEANGLGHELVRCLLQDRSGAVWAGTGFGGATKFTSDAFLHFTERDGLRSRIVSAIHRTPDGLLWMATVGGGVACWNGSQLRSYGKEDGLSDLFVVSLCDDAHGYLLAGTATGGLFRLVGDRFTHLPGNLGMDAPRVNAVRLDVEGRIWVCGDRGVYMDPGDGLFTHVQPADVSAFDLVSNGDTAWVATDKGLYSINTRALPWRLNKNMLLPSVVMTSLERDAQGNLWIGTEAHGLYRLQRDRVDSVGMSDGLSSNSVEQVLLDAYQNIWLGTRRGIDALELDVLQEEVIAIRNYGPDEGFIGIESFRNAGFLDLDSTLWFGSVRGATRYDPRRVHEDPREPLVHLTDLRLFYEKPDWKPWCHGLGPRGMPLELELPHNQNHLTFSFTGISLAYPEKVRYRYILEGYDPDWSPITATDRVTYTNIPPGDYTFRVLARNASGVWTEKPVSYAFIIDAPIWQTNSFRVGAGAFLLLGFFGVVRIRERSLRKDRERLEGMVNDRTRELAHEKERSDVLLRNILPIATAEELKTNGVARAHRYESCTVLFSDFKGFTGFSSLMDSDTLVAELDHHFRMFDRITDTCGLEKIKTIGDAYMCASGIPVPRASHALDAVLMALEMIDALEHSNAERRTRGLQEWPVRIGIHSGPVVAGVVGEKKFAYDIWGDTVNLASRMESNGEAGRVNISGVTYALVMDLVEASPRGPIKVKGKGELHMYFVHRLRPEFSIDAHGRLPNAALLALRERMNA